MLENVRIKRYEYSEDFNEKPLTSERGGGNHTVWDYITKNNDGATYEVIPSPLLSGHQAFLSSPELMD